jgi:NitT/TauT family transport system substrate-binding protein
MIRALAAALCALVLAGPAWGADKVTLMLNWYVYGEHAPFFYGKDKGFYAAQGIDLEIQEGRGSAVTAQAVAAKTVQFGYLDVATMIRAASKGAPLVAVGVLLQTSPMSAMGLAEKNIRKPEDIKGKTVAITPGDSLTQLLPLFLEKTGLKEGDFKTITGDGPAKVNTVINGQADLLLGYVMDQSMKIKDATGKDVYPIKFADYDVNLVSSGIVTYGDLLKENPDLVRRFMAASVKSIEASVNDLGGAVDAILKAHPKGGKPETLLEGFELTIPLYQAPGSATTRLFLVSDELMASTVSIMVQYAGLDAAAKDNVKSFYTNDYLPQ